MKVSIKPKIQAGFVAALFFLLGGAAWWGMQGNIEVFRKGDYITWALFAGSICLLGVASLIARRSFRMQRQAEAERDRLLTELRHSEAALLRSETNLQAVNEELEKRVTDRTSQLNAANDQLRKEMDEREKVKKALAQQESHYRTLFDLSLCGILLEDKEGTILEANEAVCKLFGYSRAESRTELIGKNIRTMVPPEYHGKIDQNIREILAGRTLEHEVENIAKDGSVRQVELRETAILLGNGSPGILVTAEDITERRRADQQLRLLAQAIATTAELISITDENDRFTFVNQAFLNAYGYTAEEVLGRTPDLLYSDRNPPQLMAEILAGARDKGWSGEVLDRRKDGSEFYIHLNTSPVLDGKGKIIGLMGVARDITARKLAAASLAETEERFRATFEQAAVGIAHVGDNGKFLRVNQRLSAIVGYSPEELVKGSFQDITHPDDLEADVEIAQKLFRGAIPSFTKEKRYVHKNGTPVWISLSASVVKNKAGNVDYAVAVMVDITERKLAQASLRASEERFVTAFKLSPDPILISRMADGCITEVNTAWETFFQFQRDDVIGRTPLQLNLFVNPQDDQRAIDKIQQQGFVRDFELNIHRKSGELRHVSLSAETIVVSGETCLLTILRDITERKTSERRALRSQRLESIGTLAGGVAHDLNNTLAPIIMGVELLRIQYPNASGIVDILENSATRSSDMVRQLLTFARGAEGERASIDPKHLVREVEKIIKGTFPKNIFSTVKCDNDLPTVLGDATQLHQVLLNLCVNARDAMPNGGNLVVEVRLEKVDETFASSEPQAKPGDYVALVVRDTGTGIPPEILDRIFDPFFTTKGPELGTGLGLSTVMGIVKGHGGFLKVESRPGHGSSFAAYFPIDRTGRHARAKFEIATEFRGCGETILVVDDEPAVRDVIRAVLRRLNCNPVTATNGLDALKQLAESQLELGAIITDLNMPHMDGLAFVRAVRGILPEIPIVLASGRFDDGLADEFKSLGVTNRLDKPFTEGQLASILKKVLPSK